MVRELRKCYGNTLSALPVRTKCGNESLGVNETARISRSCACSCVTGLEAARVSHLQSHKFYVVSTARLDAQHELLVISDTCECEVFCRVPVNVLRQEG